MRKPEFITFTGVDDRTPLNDLIALSARYPIEWGVLMSLSSMGSAQRFPGLPRLREIATISHTPAIRFAAHLCGSWARTASVGIVPVLPVALRGVYGRVQVNHLPPAPRGLDTFQSAIETPCIGQFMTGPFPDSPTRWLFDPSAGAGIRPTVWPRHSGRGSVGFAGGIGPDNVLDVIGEIDCSGPYWIDMETKVRKNEWFDVDLCQRVCEAVYG